MKGDPMARPKKSGMDYFPHDTDASSDEKLEVLTSLFGAEGYSFYFILLERIYRTNDFELNVLDADTRSVLSKKCLSSSPERFDRMIEVAVRVGCFDRSSYEERSVLTSEGIKRRSFIVIDKREAMGNQYRKKIPIKSSSGGVSSAETPVSSAEMPQSKVKESKVKERREELEARIPSILSEWNQFAEKNHLSGVIKLSEKREKGVRSRLGEIEFQWEIILQEIEGSDFLLGKKGDRSWKVDFDFIFLSPHNYLKILEGKYRNESRNRVNGKGNGIADRAGYRKDPREVDGKVRDLTASIASLYQ